MATLTKKQTAQIETALYHLARAATYINSPRVAVAVRGTNATTTLHYRRADGATLYEIDKEIGSDLTGLGAARQTLTQLLRGPQVEA